MKRTSHFGALLGVVLAVASVSGCHAGSNAATSADYDPVDGRNINLPLGATYPDPYVAIRNAVVVSEGGPAALVVTLVNNTDDAEVLESASIDGEQVLFPGGPVDLPPGEVVNVGSDAGAIAGLPQIDAAPGDFVDLTLAFTRGGDAELDVLVVVPGDEYVPDLEADVIDLFVEAATEAEPPEPPSGLVDDGAQGQGEN
jgi:hypothetical protein